MTGTKEALVLLYGAAGLVFLAALIEGFWSATVQPPLVKYTVGVVMLILTAAYLTLSGRKQHVT